MVIKPDVLIKIKITEQPIFFVFVVTLLQLSSLFGYVILFCISIFWLIFVNVENYLSLSLKKKKKKKEKKVISEFLFMSQFRLFLRI